VQHHNPPFKHYTSEDGLLSSEVHEAVQDANGYMWFGTDNGLSRFDGYTFKNYGYTDGLLHQVIFGLMIDKQGEMWILTSSGHIYIKDVNDNFRPYEYNHLIIKYSDQFYNTDRFTFSPDETELYIALNENGILKIDKQGVETLLVPDHAGHIAIDSAGVVIHSKYQNAENNSLENRTQLFEQRLSHPITIISDSTRIKFDLPRDNFYLGGSNYLRISKEYHYYRNGDYFGLINDNKNLVKKELSEHFSASTFYQNKLYLGLYDRKGVYVYENVKDFPSKVSYKMLGGKTISDFYEDRSGGLWILSVDKGLFYLPFGDTNLINKAIGLPSENISSFDFKNDSTLLVAMWDSGLAKLDLTNKQLSIIPKSHYHEPYYYYIKYNSYDNSILGGSILQNYKNETWSIAFDIKNNERFGGKKVASKEHNGNIAWVWE